MRTTETEASPSRSGLRNVWNGFRLALALVLGWPFLVILLPVWLLYSWHEQRLGRPVPHAPWAVLRQACGRETSCLPPAASRQVSFTPSPDPEWEMTIQPGRAAEGSPSLPVAAGSFPALRESAGALRGVALVTGGGRRLGAAICRELASQGFGVAVLYHRDADAAHQTAAAIVDSGGLARSFRLDWREPEGVEKLLDAACQALGGAPTLLVNNAARFQPTALDGGSWEGMSELVRVNLQGPIWLMLRVARRMADHGGGQIVNIADIWGERPLGGHAVYCATKAGLIMATQVLARDLAPAVRVNAIAPGAILPPDDGAGAEAIAAYHRLLARTPLAGQAGPEAVTGALRYLLTAPYVTGEILRVDGGRRLR
ncbi:MAG: SDR family oxidoreductase [Magnetococcales bacterium]|nr:SDR family oxidoreductase [Magnetococcales bacterium]